MKKYQVHIAVSPDFLASLIEQNAIHVLDFKCLNLDSKKIIWKLFLSAMASTIKNKSGHKGENTYV
jgi:hypothetical protein